MMFGLKSRDVSTWMLGAAAAAAGWSLPTNTLAQQAPAAAVQSESPVQQELRRLYAESGREMPEIPANVQAQAAGGLPAPSSDGAANRPIIMAPAPATPPRPNPLSSFFKKLVPGTQSTTAAPSSAPPAAPTAPPAGNTAGTARMVPPPRYTPHVSQPPRRLPSVDAAPAMPQHAAAPAPRPSSAPPFVSSNASRPATTSQAAPQSVAVQPPAATKTAPAIQAAPPVEAKQPQVTTASQFRPNTPATAGDQRWAGDEFPDPFTEMSEDEADEEDLEEQQETASPFTELTIDEPAAPSASTPAVGSKSGAVLTIDLPATSGAPILPESSQAPAAAAPQLPAQIVVAPDAAVLTPSDDHDARMERIRDRGGMKGLKGFCPVTLRDQRELKDALPEFQSSFRGQKFHLASAEAKARFDADPSRYAPAAYGADVVVLVRDKDVAEGTLDYAAWFKGRLFLFASEETSAEFLADPAKYAPMVGLE